MIGLIVLGVIGLILYFFHAIAIEALLKDIVKELRRKNGKHN